MRRRVLSLAACLAALLLACTAHGGPSGTVAAWGSQVLPLVQPGTHFTAIAARVQHNLALKSEGTIVAWGSNGSGESAVPAGLTNITAIAAGGYHSLAVREDGSVVAWGANDVGQSTPAPGLAGIVQVAAGEWHSVALHENGTVSAWGKR